MAGVAVYGFCEAGEYGGAERLRGDDQGSGRPKRLNDNG
jgi:hypothetical protein